MRYFTFSLMAFMVAMAAAKPALAYETDQFTDRLEMIHDIRDSRDALNSLVNQKIQHVIDHWDLRWGKDTALFAKKVYGVPFPANLWIGIEMQSEVSPVIDRRLPLPDHIYSDATIEGRRLGWGEQIFPNVQGRRRVNWLLRLASTVKINGVLLGTDKIGHFLSEGYKAYEIGVVKGKGDEGAMAWAYDAENTFEGYEWFGVFSNADLTANYEGYLFYRSLSEDGIYGKPAIVKWEGSRPVMQRPFDWADFVTDYWDEALNPCLYIPELQKTVYPRLEKMCGDFAKDPRAYVPRDEETLKRRYSILNYRLNLIDRLDQICSGKNARP